MRCFQAIFWGGMLLALALYGASGWMLYARLMRPHAPIFLPKRTFPLGIVIHHTATAPMMNGHRVDVAVIDAMHARRGFGIVDRDGRVYHIGYHFLILQDGTIQRGRPEHLPGAHTHGYPMTLGIVLVGNFSRASNRGFCGPLTPPPAQLDATERLTRELMRKYALTSAEVYLHRDLCPTACPGDGFPRDAFYHTLTSPVNEPAPVIQPNPMVPRI